MSGEYEFTVAQLGQYDIEDKTITDPLREDPTARAAYSGNPGFTDGTKDAHPIISASTSLLAKPEIAEALEAVYQVGGREQATSFESIDMDMALDGLKWLRRNMDCDSVVRRTAIQTKDSIMLEQNQAEQARITQIKNGNTPTIRDSENARGTKKERQQAHHADRLEQFAYVADNVPEAFEDIDFTDIFSLVEQIHSRVKADGTVAIETNGAFQALVEKRVETYLNDPAVLMNDFNALVAWHVIDKITPDREFDIVFAYGETIEKSLLEQLRSKAYTDFSDETMDEWYDVIENQPNGELYEGSPLTREQVAQQILSKGGVLANSLYLAAKRNPFEFIDRMHSFARKGLTSGNPHKGAVAGNVLDICLAQAFAGTLLNQAATQMEPDSPTQQQAMDLCVTLDGLGIAKHVTAGNLDIDQLTSEQLELVRALYPVNFLNGTIVRPGHVESVSNLSLQGMTRSEDVLTREFKDKSVSGEIDTIYGAIVGQQNAVLLRPRPQA